MLNFSQIVSRGLCRLGIFGIPAIVSLDAFPQSKAVDVVLEDACTEINVILDLKEVDALLVGGGAPGRQVDLHDPDRIGVGDGEGICAALDNHDAGNETGIEVVLTGAAHDGFGDSTAVGLIHFVSAQERFHRVNGGIERCLRGQKTRVLDGSGIFFG